MCCQGELSFIFAVHFRFFEAKVVYDIAVDSETNETILIEGTNDSLVLGVHLEPTDFRVNPIYTVYFNWSRLIVLGIIPFSMLVYFNLKIYQVTLSVISP